MRRRAVCCARQPPSPGAGPLRCRDSGRTPGSLPAPLPWYCGSVTEPRPIRATRPGGPRWQACPLALLVLAGLVAASGASAEPTAAPRTLVRVAAAADLRFAFPEIAAAFQAQHPSVEVVPTYGSSGTMYAQLTQRAPFDLFLSADLALPRQLIAAGLADAASEFRYARGYLTLWVPAASPLDLTAGAAVLLDPRVRAIAIANPQHAPYGRAAEAALRHVGLYDRVADRLVLGENVAQAAQFARSGAADIGIIALSLALAPEMRDAGRHQPLPDDSYPPIEQGGVILAWAADRTAAEHLRTFLAGPAAQAILTRYGFGVRTDRR